MQLSRKHQVTRADKIEQFKEEPNMRFTRIGMLAAAFFLTTLAASAQLQTTPQQWTIVTTQESAPNAYPLLDANGNPYPCSGQNIDNPKDSNSNCYNPLVITTDWTLTSEFGIAIGLSTALPDTFTNSNCSNSGSVASANVTGYDIFGFYQATFTVTLDNGATITFTGSPSVDPNQFSGTFRSTGSCMKGDSGQFTATQFSAVNGTYVGSFENSNGAPAASVSVTFKTDSSFNVTGTITAAKNANLCFSTLTIGSPLANTFEPSIASGDMLETVASDNTGNVVAFIASNTDANGKTLPNGGLFMIYEGLAGACSGISGTDIPFKKVESTPAPKHHSPVRVRHLAGRR
jgi:hypothetical protein